MDSDISGATVMTGHHSIHAPQFVHASSSINLNFSRLSTLISLGLSMILSLWIRGHGQDRDRACHKMNEFTKWYIG